MMMMMNCFFGMVDRRKAFTLISSRDHCQRSSSSRISDTPRAGFEPAQNLGSGFFKCSCAVVLTTTPQCHKPKGAHLLTDSVRSPPCLFRFLVARILCFTGNSQEKRVLRLLLDHLFYF